MLSVKRARGGSEHGVLSGCFLGFFFGGFVTSQDESYVKKRVTLAHSQRFNVFLGCRALREELIRAHTQGNQRDAIPPLAG